MERDFMGLNSKDFAMAVNEGAIENNRDSVNWPSSSKISAAAPHFVSFKAAEEEKMGKNALDPLASSGFMTISSADLFDPAQKQLLHSLPNQAVSVSMGNHPLFKTHFSGAIVKPQLFGGIPLPVPHSIFPSIGSVGGTPEPWVNAKVAGAPAQLTIFYAGTVNVYDDISPEKAQSIMLLAGTGTPASSNVQPPNANHGSGDAVRVNQTMNTLPGSGLSSPLSVSSHPVGQSVGVSTSNGDPTTAKLSEVHATHVSKVDAPKLVTPLRPVPTTRMLPSAIPQARKASLARFLEKRKERAMNSSPYNCKNSPECSTPGSSGISFSASSAAGVVSVSSGKETGLDM